jgi:Histidine phosphatase superfamily (branch 1)
MVPAPDPPETAAPARGRGTELVLLRHGTPADLERSLALFAGTAFALVLSAPRAGGGGAASAAHEWAARFAAQHAAPHLSWPELAGAREGETDSALAGRAWPLLERCPERAQPRILAVLSYDVVRLAVACALGYPFARSTALRVDPGRGVLLRDDPIGWVLRRSNMLSPEDSSGTPLPSGRPGDAR